MKFLGNRLQLSKIYKKINKKINKKITIYNEFLVKCYNLLMIKNSKIIMKIIFKKILRFHQIINNNYSLNNNNSQIIHKNQLIKIKNYLNNNS